MAWLIGLVFVAQALVMLRDEFHYHFQRRLPLWERIGHPLDTVTVLACFVMVLARPYGPSAIRSYEGLAIFSCLFVMKDEWIHARLCAPGERRLHALLFAFHPLVLACIAWIWPRVHPQSGAPDAGLAALFFIQFALALGFFFYQILYWNFYDPIRKYDGFRPIRDQ